MQFTPFMRWSGSKRKQSEDIVAEFPAEIDNLIIPFLGSGSVMYQVINSHIQIKGKIWINDIYEPLINIWELMIHEPQTLIDGYQKYYDIWENEGVDGYKRIRVAYNKEHKDEKDPCKFYFLTRACTRGAILFDEYEHFTTNMTAKDKPAAKSTVESIIKKWNKAFEPYKDRMIFTSLDFRVLYTEIELLCFNTEHSQWFMDPPYFEGTFYCSNFNEKDFKQYFDFCRAIRGDYAITLNGNMDEYPIPKDCYTDAIYVYYNNRIGAEGETSSRDALWMKKTDHRRYGKDIIIHSAPRGGKPGGGNVGTNPSMMESMARLEDKFDTMIHLLASIERAIQPIEHIKVGEPVENGEVKFIEKEEIS